MAYVYTHTRKDKNEIFYVGIGSDDNNYSRAKTTHKRSNYWKNITSKTDYTIDIIEDNISWNQAVNKEIELIKFYGRSNTGTGILCNLTDGGEGCNGRRHTEATKEKMRVAQKNKKLSVEHRKKIGQSLKGYQRSKQTSDRINKSRKNVILNYSVILDLDTGVYYYSVADASRAYNHIAYSTLVSYLNGTLLNKSSLIRV
ncbi:NUMOD3 domain-containing DNA-binding protein [Pedobacter sp. MR2016-24]|uniref:NUMOD3 domain-containing DNA-binding protein n=1 Tax=Pedobacter sp. MR2016-24 TaxID=2994466 RepID=UPI0022469FD2|nr:NUMOD3 domain-containing DNA-binding protein [Pedobacter sp. MR2016-24]MCX2486588.1 NUMOD3 domain-containing DNA-binding protein [Pedobacter sp. MR2016-24]